MGLFDGVVKWISDLAGGVSKAAVDGFYGLAGGVSKAAVDGFYGLAGGVSKAAVDLTGAVDDAFGGLTDFVGDLWGGWTKLGGDIWASLIGGYGSVFGRIWGAILENFLSFLPIIIAALFLIWFFMIRNRNRHPTAGDYVVKEGSAAAKDVTGTAYEGVKLIGSKGLK